MTGGGVDPCFPSTRTQTEPLRAKSDTTIARNKSVVVSLKPRDEESAGPERATGIEWREEVIAEGLHRSLCRGAPRGTSPSPWRPNEALQPEEEGGGRGAGWLLTGRFWAGTGEGVISVILCLFPVMQHLLFLYFVYI